MSALRPIRLPPNRPARFYRGGRAIEAFRDAIEEGIGGDNRPEDWIASTTTLFGDAVRGLSTLEGSLLRDVIERDPRGWLGPAHVRRLGGETGLLVKLLNAGERLPVHAHPNRGFAAARLHSRWGKTEAWVVLDGSQDDVPVWLGFEEAVTPEELLRTVESGSGSTLLDLMNRVALSVGDTVLVPAGLPHAIGPGAFLLELQEPSDLSILLEWEGFDVDGPRTGHLGLGFRVALRAVDTVAQTRVQVENLIRRGTMRGDSAGVWPLLPRAAAPFFEASLIRTRSSTVELESQFSILVTHRGQGALVTAGGPCELTRGDTHVIPWGAGTLRFEGDLEAILCTPSHGTADG